MSHSREESFRAEEIEPTSYYFENLFAIEDIVLYRAVAAFYANKFTEAIDDLSFAFSSMRRGREDQRENDFSDIGLCSMGYHEFHYNMLICQVGAGHYEEAITVCDTLLGELPQEENTAMFVFLRGLLFLALGKRERGESDLDFVSQNGASYLVRKLNEGDEIMFEPISTKKRLCCKFAHTRLIIEGVNKPVTILTRLSFSMPFVKPPNMIPNVDETVLKTELTLKNIGGVKPEAPWIRRCSYGI